MQLGVLNYRHFWKIGIATLTALFVISGTVTGSTWSDHTWGGVPDQWASYYVNYYGYGDYTFVTKMSETGYTQDWENYPNPVATPKRYSIKGGGTITVPSGIGGEVLDWFSYGVGTYLGQKYVFVESMIDTEYLGGVQGSFSSYSVTGSHIFLRSASQVMCPNGAINGPTVSNTFADAIVGDAFQAKSQLNLFFCPEGGFPLYQAAQFWHGIW